MADIDLSWLVPALQDIFKAAVMIIIGFLLGRLVYWLIKRWAVHVTGISTAKTLGKFAQWMIIILFITIATLVLFGVNSDTIAIITGAIAFALTFGFQNVIQNIVGGMLIAIDGRVRIGDWVEVGDTPYQTGPAEVMDIGFTKVTVREKYGRVFEIPSSYLIVHKVLNYSKLGCFNLHVSIELPWSEDTEKIRSLLLEEARTVKLVYPNIEPVKLEPKLRRTLRKTQITQEGFDLTPSHFMPSVTLVKTEKDSITYDVTLWTDTPLNASSATTEFITMATRRLRKEGIKESPILG